mgnify:CR=1 FL=1
MTDADDYADEWDDLTEKELLVGVLTELQQIRLLLSDADRERDADPDQYECTECRTTVPADKRERHVREQHKAPPGDTEAVAERLLKPA